MPVSLKGSRHETHPCRINRRAIRGDFVKGASGNSAGDFAGYIPAGNVVSEARGVGLYLWDCHAPADYGKCELSLIGGWKMYDLAVRLFLGCARTAHNLHCASFNKIRGGRCYWQGRVFGKPSGGGESGGELLKARGKSAHGAIPPGAARFALGVDHRGAYIKAHQRGAFGPDSFVLTAGE